jgi:predicted MFS family arabinose efflux permease
MHSKAYCLQRISDDYSRRAYRVLSTIWSLNVSACLAIASIGFAGMFTVFSYLAPTMLEVTKVSPEWIPFGLAAFGVGGIIGNIAGGKLFDRFQFRAVGYGAS